MIVNHTQNHKTYRSLRPTIYKNLKFLAEIDVQPLSTGRHDIDGKFIFSLSGEYKQVELDKHETKSLLSDMFVIFFPYESHIPSIDMTPSVVKKVLR